MSCETCGRPAENGTPTHWLGCEAVEMITSSPGAVVGAGTVELADLCEHDGCTTRKWSADPRTKYCTTHKDPKSREK